MGFTETLETTQNSKLRTSTPGVGLAAVAVYSQQSCNLQALYSLASPIQSGPPYDGDGAVHERTRI